MISNTVGTRELITLDGNGVLLHGTYHKATANGVAAPTKNIGIMFLNALSTPRSLIGDSGVYWATSFAANGYPSFRFDLPGLGDSYGEIPNDLLKFTNEGGWAAHASSKVKQLVDTQGLTGVVMFGHCAGATTAIYAASRCNECKGLILMDPYFNLPRALAPALRPGLVLWVRRSRTGAVIRAMYDRFRELPGVFGKETWPSNANVKLISRVKQVVSTGLPILILTAPQPPALGNSKLQGGNFDYLDYITSLAGRRDQFTIKTIEGTDHSFSNRAGRAAVRRHSESWLADYFPVPTTKRVLSQDDKPPSMEMTPAALGAPVPAYVSLGEMGAI
jgi:pimeloyl-ACP methyl ester carboxylesterase